MAIDRSVLRDVSGRSLARPVVYLDHSTLVDAFEGARREGANATTNVELAAVVEDVARRGTLCLSIVHVIELVQRPRLEEALAMARWLDGLGHLWFQLEGASLAELEGDVRRRLRMRGAPSPCLPIHHTMTAAIRDNIKDLSPNGIAQVLRAPNIHGVIRDTHGKLRDRTEAVRAMAIELLTRTHEDRSSIPEGTPLEEVRAITSDRFYAHLVAQARRALNTAPVDPGEDYPSDLSVRQAVRDALDDPDAIPMNKIARHLQRQVAEEITRKPDPRSRNFRETFQSFVWDARHALAAAVVDVFTCDSFVYGVMGDFRTSRGMERQISLRGGRSREDLVAELRRQCEILRD
jgi:hypothetical protein